MTTPSSTVPQSHIPMPTPPAEPSGPTARQRKLIIAGTIVAIVLLIIGGLAAAFWLVSNPTQAAPVRDVFIIFMALEFMFIGAALVVLVIQLAILTNMLQHEIKPILQSTTETLNTVRGTTAFLAENVVEPVIKLNAALAALGQVADTLSVFGRFGRKK